MANVVFNTTQTVVPVLRGNEFYFSLAPAASGSSALAYATNTSLPSLRFELLPDADTNSATYALSGQLLSASGAVADAANGILTFLDTSSLTAGFEHWRASFSIAQTLSLVPDGPDAGTQVDGFYYVDDLGNNVTVNLNWLSTRGSDGAIATFVQSVNKAVASDEGVLFSGRVIDSDNNGVADKLLATLGERAIEASLSVSGNSWNAQVTQALSGRVQNDTAGKVAGLYFDLADLGNDGSWRFNTQSTISTTTTVPGQWILKLAPAPSGSFALASASASILPTLRFDLLADTDNQTDTYALKALTYDGNGRLLQSSDGNIRFSDTVSTTAGPDTWSASFLVKESFELLPDSADADTLADGFRFIDALDQPQNVLLTWRSTALSDGTIASFSKVINQATPTDTGTLLNGRLLDSDGNGAPDHLVMSIGSATLYGALVKSGESWQLYYTRLAQGNVILDGEGAVAGLSLQSNAITYASQAPEIPSGVDIRLKATYWKGYNSTSPINLTDLRLSEGGQTGATSSDGRLNLSGVEDADGVLGDGRMELQPTMALPANMKSAVTLTDVLAALKIYLGKPLPESYASPMNFVAADFDDSGSVTLTDVLQLLKYYLGKSSTAAPTWDFINAADLQGAGAGQTLLGADGTSPISKATTSPHAISHDFANQADIHIIGILRGDVDGSWTP